jgi:hypothetical protein
MKIVETDFYDIGESNIDESKLDLANTIISNVYPLFDEVYFDFLKKERTIQSSIKSKHDLIQSERISVEETIKKYSRKKKVRKLLERITKIIEAGLSHDSSVRNETVALLRVIDKLSDEKLDHHLNETIQLLNKRFAR